MATIPDPQSANAIIHLTKLTDALAKGRRLVEVYEDRTGCACWHCHACGCGGNSLEMAARHPCKSKPDAAEFEKTKALRKAQQRPGEWVV